VERLRFITHKGHKILVVDFSGIEDPKLFVDVLAQMRALVAQQPRTPKLRTLIETSGAAFNSEVVEAIKMTMVHNRPWVTAAAVTGMSALHRVIYRVVKVFVRRNMEAFDSQEAAKEWLAAQSEEAVAQAS
jgi:hypothetical protein